MSFKRIFLANPRVLTLCKMIEVPLRCPSWFPVQGAPCTGTARYANTLHPLSVPLHASSEGTRKHRPSPLQKAITMVTGCHVAKRWGCIFPFLNGDFTSTFLNVCGDFAAAANLCSLSSVSENFPASNLCRVCPRRAESPVMRDTEPSTP